jgi:hypothetical protein
MLSSRMSLAQIWARIAWSLTQSAWRAEAHVRRRARAAHSVPSPAPDCNLLQVAYPSCNSQSQLAAFPRSVDYGGLKWHLSPFKINTSKNVCTFRISLISGHLKSLVINTSVNFDFKPPIINTSKKQGGGGSSCNSSCNWDFESRAQSRPQVRRGGDLSGIRACSPWRGGAQQIPPCTMIRNDTNGVRRRRGKATEKWRGE